MRYESTISPAVPLVEGDEEESGEREQGGLRQKGNVTLAPPVPPAEQRQQQQPGHGPDPQLGESGDAHGNHAPVRKGERFPGHVEAAR